MPTMPAGPLPPTSFVTEVSTRVDPDQRTVAPEPEAPESFPSGSTEANVLHALALLEANDASEMRIVKLAYMGDWPAFDRAWRVYIAAHPESHPVVGRVRAEMSLLS